MWFDKVKSPSFNPSDHIPLRKTVLSSSCALCNTFFHKTSNFGVPVQGIICVDCNGTKRYINYNFRVCRNCKHKYNIGDTL